MSYDRFDDWTEVETPWVRGDFVSVRAEYSCAGRPGCEPASIWVYMDLNDDLVPPEEDRYHNPFHQITPTWRPPSERSDDDLWYTDVVVLLDGETRLRQGQAHGESYSTSMELDLSELRQIATADTAELRILNVEGALTARQQTVLRRMVESVEVSDGR